MVGTFRTSISIDFDSHRYWNRHHILNTSTMSRFQDIKAGGVVPAALPASSRRSRSGMGAACLPDSGMRLRRLSLRASIGPRNVVLGKKCRSRQKMRTLMRCILQQTRSGQRINNQRSAHGRSGRIYVSTLDSQTRAAHHPTRGARLFIRPKSKRAAVDNNNTSSADAPQHFRLADHRLDVRAKHMTSDRPSRGAAGVGPMQEITER